MKGKKDIEALKLSAPECQRNYICLENPKDVLGDVDYCVNNKVLFVKPEINNYCPYLHSFGYSHFCSCAIRMQVYLERNKNVS